MDDEWMRHRAMVVGAKVLAVDDSGVDQVVTVQTHNGVVRTGVPVLAMHGHAANPGVGAFTVLLALEGDQANYVALPLTLPGYRLGNLPPGGGATHDDAGNRLQFPGDGTGLLTTAGVFRMLVAQLLVQAAGGTTFSGPVTFNDPVTFKAAVTFQSDVTIGGSLHVSGAVTAASVNGR